MDQLILSQALKSSTAGRRFAFATVVKSTLKGTPRKAGAKMIVYEDGSTFGTIGGGRNEKDAQKRCIKSIKTSETEMVVYDYFGEVGQSVCGGQIHVFIEPFIPTKKFILCGAGHIALPLSIILKMMDYHLMIIDNRRSFANKERFPHADKILVGKHSAKLKKIKFDEQTHVMVVTQGNEYDYECLESVIGTQAGYIGVISSKAKRIKFFKRLKAAGYSNADLKRVNIPAGIDIGAQYPAEIAVSIAAELVQISNRNSLNTDKFVEKVKKK